MSRGIILMEKITNSSHAKKQLIIKKIIHSNMRLLKSEAISGSPNPMLSAVTSCVLLMSMIEWKEIRRDCLLQKDSKPVVRKRCQY